MLRQILVGVPRSIVLLRGQSSSAYFQPVKRPVERLKLVFAVHSAVHPAMRSAMAHANQIYKHKLMKNTNAKLQAQ